MNFPVWLIVLVGISFYCLVGFVQVVARAYLSGRRGRYGTMDGFDGFAMMCLWPIFDSLWVVCWFLDKFEDLLEFFRKRGAESVMPARNEFPGRKID